MHITCKSLSNMDVLAQNDNKINNDLDIDVLLCEYCKCGDVSNSADGMCLQCEEYLCLACFNQHLRGKKNRDHELVNVIEDEIRARKTAEEVEKCKQHNGKTIGIYCREHDYVGCESCILSDHSNCKQEIVSAISTNFEESVDFADLKNKLRQFGTEHKRLAQNLREYKSEFEDIQEKLLKEIRGFRKMINVFLDEAESVVMTELKQLLSFNDNLLGKLEIDCKSLDSKLKNLKEKVDTATYKEESLFIQTVQSKPVVMDIEQQLIKCNHSVSKVKHYYYEFIPDDTFKEMLSLKRKLGDIRASVMTRKAETGHSGAMSPNACAAVGLRSSIVGARVQRSSSHLRLFGKPGTVVGVNQDGSVKVKWDKTGKESTSLRIGKGRDKVELL